MMKEQLLLSIYDQLKLIANKLILAGDVTGKLSANTLSAINGIPLSVAPPTIGQVLSYDGTQWVPATVSMSGSYSFVEGLSISGTTVSFGGTVTSDRILDTGASLASLILQSSSTSVWNALIVRSPSGIVNVNLEDSNGVLVLNSTITTSSATNYYFEFKTLEQIIDTFLGITAPQIGINSQAMSLDIDYSYNIYSKDSTLNLGIAISPTLNNYLFSSSKNDFLTEFNFNTSDIFNSRIYIRFENNGALLNNIQFGTILINSAGLRISAYDETSDGGEFAITPDLTYFFDTNSNKRGIQYLNFGETDEIDSTESADYSTLANNSLVPRRFVEDFVRNFISSPVPDPITTSNGTTTLSPASRFNQLINGTADSHTIVLGPAISYNTAKIYKLINNSSTFVSVNLGLGTTVLTRLEPRTILELTLADNAGFDGVWFYKKVYPENAFVYTDDFIAGVGTSNKGWLISNAGAGSGAFMVAGSLQRNGIVELRTGTTITGYATISDSTSNINLGSGYFVVEIDLRVLTLSDATNEFTVRLGFGDVFTLNTDVVDGAYFEYNRPLYGNVWVVKTASSSTRTTVVTTVPVSSSYARFRVEFKPNLATFIFSPTEIYTIDTNLPVLPGQETSCFVKIAKTAGTTTRAVTIDKITQIYIP